MSSSYLSVHHVCSSVQPTRCSELSLVYSLSIVYSVGACSRYIIIISQLLNNTSRCVNIVAWPLTRWPHWWYFEPGNYHDYFHCWVCPVSRCLADAVHWGYDGCLWLLISVHGPANTLPLVTVTGGSRAGRMMLCTAPSRQTNWGR